MAAAADYVSLVGAPFQWAAIFHKADMAFENGTAGLEFYKSPTQRLGHNLPCKVSCDYCRTPIMDEGRNMVLLFPTLISFKSVEDRNTFKPQYVASISISQAPQRVLSDTTSAMHSVGPNLCCLSLCGLTREAGQVPHLLLAESCRHS